MKLNSFQNKLREDLISVAQSATGIITYKELGARYGFFGDDDYNYSKLANAIGAISEYEVENKRPMLSAIVVRRDDLRPGIGFFKLAKALKRMKGSYNSDINRDTFFINELANIHTTKYPFNLDNRLAETASKRKS